MKHYYLFLFAVALLASCTKTDEMVCPAGEETTEAVTRSAAVKDDPYRLSLMQQVLDEKSAQTPGAERIVLEATDLYVRFLPKDSLQVMTIMQADIPHLFQPLNESVSYTPDSEYDIPEGFRWIYSVVPADYQFPEGIEYEIIYEVFIQRPAEITRSGNNGAPQLSPELYDDILGETLVRTGYAPLTRSAAAPEDWTPSARFRFVVSQRLGANTWTDTLALINLPVHIFQGTKLQTRLTNAEGETGLFGPVRGMVDYRVAWDNEKFILWDGEIFGIENRPTANYADRYKSTLDVLFTEEDPFNYYRAGAFRAFHAYFHEARPGMETLVRRQKLVHVALNDGPSLHGYSGYFEGPAHHPIKLWTKHSHTGRYYSALDAMETSFHELGHASHYYKAPDNMVFRGNKDSESWANGVAYGYMRSFFPEYRWDGTTNNDYTRVVECMLKNGYSFDQIQFAFYGSSGWNSWHERMQEFGVLDNRLLALIFSAPNTWTFDMDDVIQSSVSEMIYRNQPVLLDFIPGARGVLSADSWEVVEGTGAVIETNEDERLVIRFTEPGIKRVRATVTLREGVTKTYEKEFDVLARNLISAPSEVVQNYELPLTLLPQTDYPCAYVFRWSVDGGDATVTEESRTKAVFRFPQPGMRTLTAMVWFSQFLPMIEYEIPVSVKAADVSTLFAVVDKPTAFRYDTEYEAEYKGTGSIEVTRIGLNHNVFLPYFEFTTWSYDKRTSRLKFTVPGKAANFDYTLLIFYKVNGREVEDPAELVVSNYRDHI